MTKRAYNGHLRVLAVWVLFIPLAILNGAVRESLLFPMLGRTALPLSGMILSCLILLTTYLLFSWLKIKAQQYWQVGATWLILTVLFEFGSGHFVMNKSWGVLLEQYDVRTGNLWVLVLFVVLVSPWLAGKLRGKVYR